MKENGSVLKKATNRRSFFKNGMVAAGAATMGAGLLSGGVAALIDILGDMPCRPDGQAGGTNTLKIVRVGEPY